MDFNNLSPCNFSLQPIFAIIIKTWVTPIETPSGSELCDSQLPEEWYRFVGAAGTKMLTSRVSANRCGTKYSGWLDGRYPTVEDGEVYKDVCFSNDAHNNCKSKKTISVKNCGSYFIYKLLHPPLCNSRYCGTDWIWANIPRVLRGLINRSVGIYV